MRPSVWTHQLAKPHGPDERYEKRIVLQPANAEFAPLVITPPNMDGVRVIAEVVEVLSHSKTDRAGSPAAEA